MADERDEVVESGETAAAPVSAEVRFPCENCGAETTWDPDADAMLCAFCNTSVPVPRGEGTILERPLTEEDLAERGYGVERRVLQCSNCGARVTLDESATASACVYCGSAQVLAQEANRNAIRPESVVPLDVGKGTAERAFRSWIRGLWFRPGALKRADPSAAVGLYVPFWTYDCAVHSDWSADAGYYYYTTETYWTTENGRRVQRTRQVRHTRWVPAWGKRDDFYNDLLINASRGLPEGLVHRLGEFDLRALAPYRPEYLAGWRAEEYQRDLAAGWEAAQGFVEGSQRRRCSGDVPGDTQRNLRVKNTVRDVRWKHILLPIWVIHYRFNKRVYPVLIHGQTGRVVGEAPYSVWKILLLVLIVLGAVGVVLAAAAMRGR